MECHRLIKGKYVYIKVLLWQPTSLTVERTFLFNLFIKRSNHYITSVNPVWSTMVMVEPTTDLYGKYPCEHLFIWTQISYTPFFHLVGWFASLWKFPIYTVWTYRQSCNGWNSHIHQHFHRTPCYFWCGYQWLRKKHARYKFRSPCKWENSNSCIWSEGFNILNKRQGMLWCTTSPGKASSAIRSATKLHACSADKVSCR